MPVPAKKKLRRWLLDHKAEDWTQKRIADAVGVQQSAVSRWCDDESKDRPTEPRQLLLEKLTGIARGDWLTAKERREAKRAEERVRLAGAAE